MDLDFQLSLAKQFGSKWEKDYKHHLTMVERPLPFMKFKVYKEALDKHLRAKSDKLQNWRDGVIDFLWNVVGY